MSTPNAYPMIFHFHEPVANDSFIAAVELRGWGIAKQAGETWTFDGVAPVGTGVGSPSCSFAYLSFLQKLRLHLFELAEGKDFASFKSQAVQLVSVSDDVRATWLAAVAARPPVPSELRHLQTKKTSENEPFVEVHLLKKKSPLDEIIKHDALATAA